jgi:hypothetical protein
MVEESKTQGTWKCVSYLDKVSEYKKMELMDLLRNKQKYMNSREVWQILYTKNCMYFALKVKS